MKKVIGALFFSLVISHSALAVTNIPWTKAGCESVQGTWITAHSPTDEGCDAAHCNGKNFCRAPKPMNYWSALIWCQSIGHKLPDIETLCPSGLASGSTCANLTGRMGAEVWSTTAVNNSSQYAGCNTWVGSYQTERDRARLYVACME